MVFRDDECRLRTDNAPANFTTLKHIALNLTRRAPGKDSLRLIPIGMDADRWSASLRPADDRRPAVAGAIGDELSSSPIGIKRKLAAWDDQFLEAIITA